MIDDKKQFNILYEPKDEQNKIIQNVDNKINEIVKQINIILMNNKPKIIICYSPYCEFCDEYLESVDKEYKGKENSMDVKLFDVSNMKEKIWAKHYGVKALPCTLFMNGANIIKGKIDGRINVEKINIVAQQIFMK